MRVRYTPRAQSDLDSIFSYLDAQAPNAAQAVKTAIVRRIALLGDFPLALRNTRPRHHRAGAKRRVPVIPIHLVLCLPNQDGRDKPGHDAERHHSTPLV